MKLDGADTALAHIVTEDIDALQVGARVEAVWKPDDERDGIDPRHRLLPGDRRVRTPMNEPPKEPVKYVESTVYLPYHYVAGDNRARYLRALKDKHILGSKCSKTGKVFVPPLVELARELRAVRRARRASPTAASSRPSASSTSR